MIKLFQQDLWTAQQKFRAMGADFGCRMTIIRHPQGLILYSPITLTDELFDQVKSLGEVTHIIAPNSFHHLFIEPWCKRYPQAQLLATRRVQNQHPKINVTTILAKHAQISLPDAVDHVVLNGRMGNSEIILFHKLSGSLIVGDLMFNFKTRTRFDKLVFWLFGITEPPSPSRLFKLFYRGLEHNQNALLKIKSWPVTQIIVAHGQVINTNAKKILANSCDLLIK